MRYRRKPACVKLLRVHPFVTGMCKATWSGMEELRAHFFGTSFDHWWPLHPKMLTALERVHAAGCWAKSVERLNRAALFHMTEPGYLHVHTYASYTLCVNHYKKFAITKKCETRMVYSP